MLEKAAVKAEAEVAKHHVWPTGAHPMGCFGAIPIKRERKQRFARNNHLMGMLPRNPRQWNGPQGAVTLAQIAVRCLSFFHKVTQRIQKTNKITQ